MWIKGNFLVEFHNKCNIRQYCLNVTCIYAMVHCRPLYDYPFINNSDNINKASNILLIISFTDVVQ